MAEFYWIFESRIGDAEVWRQVSKEEYEACTRPKKLFYTTDENAEVFFEPDEGGDEDA